MKIKKKSIVVVILLLFLILFGFGFQKWRNHKATIVIHYVDQNGTSITYDRTINLRTGYIKNIDSESQKINGYKPVHGNRSRKFIIAPIHFAEYSIVYRPINLNQQIQKIKNSKYLAVTFQPMSNSSIPKKDGSQLDPFPLARNYDGQSGRDSLRIIYSENGIKWKQAYINYPKVNVRDPSIKKVGNYYYIVYTHGLLKTRDFQHWQNISWHYSKKFSNEWAPEFFTTKKGKTEIIMAASLKKNNKFQLYVSDFKNGQIKNNWKKLSGVAFPDNMIDGHIDLINEKYYLWFKNENTKQLIGAYSDQSNSKFISFTKIQKSYSGMEGPETLWKNGQNVILYFDTYDLPQALFHGIHYVVSNDAGKNWSSVKKIDAPFTIRHFEPILNK